jgi:hypothetical protein
MASASPTTNLPLVIADSGRGNARGLAIWQRAGLDFCCLPECRICKNRNSFPSLSRSRHCLPSLATSASRPLIGRSGCSDHPPKADIVVVTASAHLKTDPVSTAINVRFGSGMGDELTRKRSDDLVQRYCSAARYAKTRPLSVRQKILLLCIFHLT